jgi:hypothetical protein
MPKRIRVPVGQNEWYLAGFIKGLLHHGPLPSHEIERIAIALGYSLGSMQRAKKLVDVVAYRENNMWHWELSGREES